MAAVTSDGACGSQAVTAGATDVKAQEPPEAVAAAPSSLSTQRVPKPHAFFPFDLFSGRAADGYLRPHLQNELSYVRSHCMVPPYPWGQVIYYDFIIGNVLPNVEGDFAEFGIGQGGTSIFFARMAKSYGRKFLAVDSFEGLPPPDVEKDNAYFKEGDYRPTVGQDNYQNFLQYKTKFDVDDSLHVAKAFFKDVEIPPEFKSFAFVHMDSDLYDSVYDTLTKVWDLIPIGGCIAVDDFFHHAQGPARAVSDFFRARSGEEPPLMFVVPTYAALILKGRSAFMSWQLEAGGKKRPVMYSPRALDGNYYSFTLARSCKPFMRAIEDSLARVEAACAEAAQRGESTKALGRVRDNAAAFLDFLRYPDDGARSGCDILRYLLPLEDLFDITQGNLCGVDGVERNTIEIKI